MSTAVAPEPLRISDWVEEALYIDGSPFRFTGREYLRRVYDTMAPNTLLKCARAAEKSTAICSKMVSMGANYPLFRTLYVSASQKQAKDFSRDQLKQRLQSPWVMDRHFNPKVCDDNVELKSLTNGSWYRMRHMYGNPDRVRGLRCDLLCIDEIQDIETGFMPVVEECLTQSAWGLSLYSGTPKTFDNPIQYYWEYSTQEEWEPRCPGCWKWQEGGLMLENIGKRGPICRYCGHSLDVSAGEWVAYGDRKIRLGFRIPQLLIPYFQDEKKWKEKILDKLERFSLSLFYNEVLGLSYDTADKPLTEKDLKAVSRHAWITPEDTERIPNIPCFMGVDWGSGGSSKTVMTIGGFVQRDVFQFFWGHIFRPVDHPSPEDVLREIARVANLWNCVAVGVDWGFGAFENKRLAPMIGDDRCWEFQNIGMQRAPIKWNVQAGRFTHSYTQTLTDLFAAIKEKRALFPRWSHWKPFAEHFLNVRKEYNEHTGHVAFVNSPDRPDDAAHSCNYAYMAARLWVHRWLQRNIVDKSLKAERVPIPPFLKS